jgi:hypothetical protein
VVGRQSFRFISTMELSPLDHVVGWMDGRTDGRKADWIGLALLVDMLTDGNSVLQAILFYIPRWLWKNWEAGKVSALRMDLNLGIISDVEKKLKKKLLIDYLYSNLKHHNFWAYRYFFCEFLALLNVSGRISNTRRLPVARQGCTSLVLLVLDTFRDPRNLSKDARALQEELLLCWSALAGTWVPGYLGTWVPGYLGT